MVAVAAATEAGWQPGGFPARDAAMPLPPGSFHFTVMPMPVFRYKVARPDGTTQEGHIEEGNEGAARARLEGQGLLVFQLHQQGGWGSLAVGGRGRGGRLSSQDFLIFNQELVALTRAGLSILRVFDLLIERARHQGFRATLETVRRDIRGGSSVSDALSHHPTYFPDLYIASIRAGEQAGNLPEVLKRYIAHLKLMIGLRQKVVKAVTYPAFLLVFSLIVIAFLLLYVVPSFMEVYETTTSLPRATQILITIVETAQANFLPALIVLLTLAVVYRFWYGTPDGRRTWDQLILRTPGLGDLLMKQHTIQFSRTLATVLSGGTPVVDALLISRGSVSNRYLSDGLNAAVGQIREGAPLAASLSQHRILPLLALEMLAVGEETGAVEMMLRDVAEFYESEMDFRLGQLTTWIETGMLLAVGIIVGTIVVVTYLPIFQMAGSM